MGKAGFKKWWDWGTESVTKWEKSLFGGYDRLITDHPRVKLDLNVDFDCAPLEGQYLSLWEKEKILKIFLSKAKNTGCINDLLVDAKTESETNFFGREIKTTINDSSKKRVLDLIRQNEKEYAPLFKHYQEFIINSEIFFKQKDEDEEEKDSGNQKQDGDEGESENGNGQQDKKSNPATDAEIHNNRAAFLEALRDLKEEEYTYNSLCDFNEKTVIKIQSARYTETKYSEAEINVADRLTKLLDISFDPATDTVKNLRLGKLDIAKIAEIPAGNIAIYQQTIEEQTTKPFSVVVLCDESYSMTNHDRIKHQYNMVKSLYRSFSDILPQDKIFIYGHSGDCIPELYVYHDPYNQNFLTTIDNMLGRSLQENYDGPVIEEIYKQVRAITSDRIIFIILSDGEPLGHNYGHAPSDIVQMKQIIEKCKRDEFVTVGIGIEAHHVSYLYQYSAVVDDLDDMPKKVSHIVNHVVKSEFQ